MAEAMIRTDKDNGDIVLSVHDEVVIEVGERYVDSAKQDFKKALLQVPAWAQGLPIAIDEPWVNERYVNRTLCSACRLLVVHAEITRSTSSGHSADD
jgi:hypothetical protein